MEAETSEKNANANAIEPTKSTSEKKQKNDKNAKKQQQQQIVVEKPSATVQSVPEVDNDDEAKQGAKAKKQKAKKEKKASKKQQQLQLQQQQQPQEKQQPDDGNRSNVSSISEDISSISEKRDLPKSKNKPEIVKAITEKSNAKQDICHAKTHCNDEKVDRFIIDPLFHLIFDSLLFPISFSTFESSSFFTFLIISCVVFRFVFSFDFLPF